MKSISQIAEEEENLTTYTARLEREYNNAKAANEEMGNAIERLANALGLKGTASQIVDIAIRDTERLDWLEKAIPGMPDMSITNNHDSDEEDWLGMIPQGWNIRVPSICAESITVNAPTLRAAIDAASRAIDHKTALDLYRVGALDIKPDQPPTP